MVKGSKLLAQVEGEIAEEQVVREQKQEEEEEEEDEDDEDEDEQPEPMDEDDDGDSDDVKRPHPLNDLFGSDFALPKESDPAWRAAISGAKVGGVPKEISVKQKKK